MEVELSQQKQQQCQYYNSSSCYSHYYPFSDLAAVDEQFPEEANSAAAFVTTATTMKGDDLPAPYPPANYWSWPQSGSLDPNPLDLFSDTAAAAFLNEVPSSPISDYLAAASRVPLQQDCSPPPPPPVSSAFTPYAGRGRLATTTLVSITPSTTNVHVRLLELLRRIDAESKKKSAAPVDVMEDSGGSGGGNLGGSTSRCFRHMMRERQRRERLSQSYADLYAVVSGRRSKADKNSIVQASAAYVAELRAKADRLRRRNQELTARAAAAAAAHSKCEGPAKVRLRVGNPCSSVDSVMTALRRLKGMGVRAVSIRAQVSPQELNAAIDIDTNMATAEVEAAVQGALVGVEKKLRGSSGCFDLFGVGGTSSTVSLGVVGSTVAGSGPRIVPNSYPRGGAAGVLLHASAPSRQQLLPGRIGSWPNSHDGWNHRASHHLP